MTEQLDGALEETLNESLEETLIEFPCRFPIKVMGKKHDYFEREILQAIQTHDPEVSLSDITTRESSKGNYLGATVQVNATSKKQLDAIYMTLTKHPLVKVVL